MIIKLKAVVLARQQHSLLSFRFVKSYGITEPQPLVLTEKLVRTLCVHMTFLLKVWGWYEWLKGLMVSLFRKDSYTTKGFRMQVF